MNLNENSLDLRLMLPKWIKFTPVSCTLHCFFIQNFWRLPPIDGLRVFASNLEVLNSKSTCKCKLQAQLRKTLLWNKLRVVKWHKGRMKAKAEIWSWWTQWLAVQSILFTDRYLPKHKWLSNKNTFLLCNTYLTTWNNKWVP